MSNTPGADLKLTSLGFVTVSLLASLSIFLPKVHPGAIAEARSCTWWYLSLRWEWRNRRKGKRGSRKGEEEVERGFCSLLLRSVAVANKTCPPPAQMPLMGRNEPACLLSAVLMALGECKRTASLPAGTAWLLACYGCAPFCAPR